MEPWKELTPVALPAVAEAVRACDCGAQSENTPTLFVCVCMRGQKPFKRGKNHYKSGHVESFSYASGEMVSIVHVNRREQRYKVSLLTLKSLSERESTILKVRFKFRPNAGRFSSNMAPHCADLVFILSSVDEEAGNACAQMVHASFQPCYYMRLAHHWPKCTQKAPLVSSCASLD
ncbi:hypothetical protein ABVT39_019667 [Epinephelus coioides]